MGDNPRDFWPEPIKTCKICGREFAATDLVENAVCSECYWELADEFPETDKDNDEEDEDDDEES